MPSLSQLGQGWTLAVPSEVVSGKAVKTPPKIGSRQAFRLHFYTDKNVAGQHNSRINANTSSKKLMMQLLGLLLSDIRCH